MITEFIKNYAEIGYAGIVIITMIWLVRYLVKQTTEDKIYYRELITNDMKDLHNDSLKNAELNKQTIVLQNGLAKDLREHNGHSKKAWDKAISSLGIICERLNGGDPKMKKELEWYKKRGIVDRRSADEKVSVERRK
jgi:hypothetical protein